MAGSFWDEEELVGSVPKGREEVQVRRVAKGGRRYLDLRSFYPGANGQLLPGKGIALPTEVAPAVLSLLQQALAAEEADEG
ncbi:MAG: transcriptional coactivator p15/PC4 family protein [Thermaerobacter sp.]|nr:transcriptional coactivator p15/PC4 family protein [Thermaerobacter sp.]